MHNRPKWRDLTSEQQALFNNGIGPGWFPTFIRKTLTNICSKFFDEANWGHHDLGYYIGATETDRKEYDIKFFNAMLRDAHKVKGSWNKNICIVLSYIFYGSVRVFGVFSFKHSKTYRTLDECLALIRS